MQDIEQYLKEGYKKACLSCFSYTVQEKELLLRPTPKHFQGQFTFVLHPLAKKIGGTPLSTIGEAVGQALKAHGALVAGYEVVQGFLNLWLADKVWVESIVTLTYTPPQQTPSSPRTLIEYSSPNTNKPLHLGHMRNTFLGDSLARILAAVGHNVHRVNLINDRGIHICKSMAAYLQTDMKEQPSVACKGDHLVGKYYVRFEKRFQEEIAALQQQGMSKEAAIQASPIMQQAKQLLVDWEQGNTTVRACWKKLNGWVYTGFADTYARMGITFDKTYYESTTYLLGKRIVQEGLTQGLFYTKNDGTVAVNMEKEGLGEKVLLRADGTSVYITQDLGTADVKYKDYAFDTSLYVVGDEQNHHFKVLFSLLKRLGRTYATQLRHISYGMVDLPSGKMKSREGNVVDVDQLLDELEQLAKEKTQALGKSEGLSKEAQNQLYKDLSLGAIKYFLLSVHPTKRIVFDPATSMDFHGTTGVFIQYTHARICSLMSRAGDTYATVVKQTNHPHNIQPFTTIQYRPKKLKAEEQALIAHLLVYTKQLQTAADMHDSAILAQYLYDLARYYNRWYEIQPILKAPTPGHRHWCLMLCCHTQWYLKHGLSLLGIAAPTRI